jgi:alpha-L-fucosidase
LKKKILEQVEKTIERGRFKASWDSLEAYEVPKWYQDAKFGIFIHWGVYSVPAFGNEWYPRNMYRKGTPEFDYHVKKFGPHNKFGYKDFIPMFKAEKFDADAWAELFEKAGARFVVPVAEHHDGFQMYESALSKWNAKEMGPKRDLIKEIADAVRKRNMVLGLSNHRAEHWWYMDEGMKFDSDVRDPKYADFYGPAKDQPGNEYHRDNYMSNSPDQDFLEDWLARSCELIDKYQPQIMWYDWWIMNLSFKPYLKKLAAFYYNRGEEWNKGVAINYKYDAFPVGTAVFDVERGQLSGMRSLFWQTDTAVSKNSWGYIENHDYKDAEDIVCDMVDIVSKNGALLLNIGPRADGTIPEEEQRILLEIGDWLSINGEAIYETRPWEIFGEGPTQVKEGSFTDTHREAYTSEDFRFTTKDGAVYATVLSWPEDGELKIKCMSKGSGLLTDEISKIELVGSSESVEWNRMDDGLHIKASGRPAKDYCAVFKISF